MSADPWNGWQAFSDAARSYLAAANQATQQRSAQQFSDFLREQFATSPKSWAAAQMPPPPWVPAGGPTSTAGEPAAFGPTREHQQRAQRMLHAAERMHAAQRRLQRLWSDVLRDAASRFVSQLSPAAAGTSSAQDLRQLYDRWIDCAEDAYAQVARGEAFCAAQADFTNAASQWKREQQRNIEQWCRLLDMPTRDEMNSLIRRLRTVEKHLQAQQQPKSKAVASKRRASSSTRAGVKRVKGRKKRS